MDENPIEISNKQTLSIAAVLLFAPLIPFFVNKGEYSLSPDDESFIKGYIKYGLIIDGILGLAILLWILIKTSRIRYIYYAMFIFCIILIAIGVIMIFLEKPIFAKGKEYDLKTIKSGNIDILINYVPIYNFYLWHNQNTNIKSFRWLKESILFIYLWIIIALLSNSISINVILLIIYILRVATLMGGVDFLADKEKENIDKMFNKNPEEIFAYILGPIHYFVNKILFKNKVIKSIAMLIDEYKKEYSTNYMLTGKNKTKASIILYLQYVLLIVWIGMIYYLTIYKSNFNILGSIYFLPIIFIIGRYGSCLIKKQLPRIPIFNEIAKGLLAIF